MLGGEKMTDAGKTLSLDATKALIEALAFRDFSRWRREDDYGWHDMTFALGLGYGYRLYAHPGADRISRPTEFELVHDGGFMLCSMMEFSGLCRGCLELGGFGCSATLRLDRTMDPEAYADSIAGTVCKDRVTFTKYGKTKTTHVYASEAPYAGDDGRETESHGLSWEFKQGLMRAAYAQDYPWIDGRLYEFWNDRDC